MCCCCCCCCILCEFFAAITIAVTGKSLKTVVLRQCVANCSTRTFNMRPHNKVDFIYICIHTYVWTYVCTKQWPQTNTCIYICMCRRRRLLFHVTTHNFLVNIIFFLFILVVVVVRFCGRQKSFIVWGTNQRHHCLERHIFFLVPTIGDLVVIVTRRGVKSKEQQKKKITTTISKSAAVASGYLFHWTDEESNNKSYKKKINKQKLQNNKRPNSIFG